MKNHCAAWAPLRSPLNLQLFAEPADAPAEQTEQTEQNTAQQQPAAPSMEETMRAMQSEIDRRVTQALAKQKREFEKQMSLSGLDEQERKSREKDQQIEELTKEKKRNTTIGIILLFVFWPAGAYFLYKAHQNEKEIKSLKY